MQTNFRLNKVCENRNIGYKEGTLRKRNLLDLFSLRDALFSANRNFRRSGADPTILSHNASVVKIDNTRGANPKTFEFTATTPAL
jgi:hypothetical protein